MTVTPVSCVAFMMQLFHMEDTLDLVTFNPTAKDISIVSVAKFSLAWWDYFAPKNSAS